MIVSEGDGALLLRPNMNTKQKMLNTENLVVRILSLRSSPALFSADIDHEILESKGFQALPQFNRKQISKFQESMASKMTLRDSLIAMDFPVVVSDDQLKKFCSMDIDEPAVFWLFFQCLAWIAAPETGKTIERFTVFVECLNASFSSKFVREVGEVFILICNDALEHKFVWNEASLVGIVKHVFWNDSLGTEAGFLLPIVAKKAMATGNKELIENLLSLIIAIYESNKSAALGCSAGSMIKAIGKYLNMFSHNALMLVSAMSRTSQCPELDSFYQSIPSIAVERIASQLMKDEQPVPKLSSTEKNKADMQVSDIIRQMTNASKNSITAMFPLNLSTFVSDLRVIIDNSAPESVAHIVRHGAGVIERLAGYDLAVGVVAIFVEVMEDILQKTDATPLLKAIVSTVVFDPTVSVFGEYPLSEWGETIRNAFFVSLVNKSPKTLHLMMTWRPKEPLFFAEQCARAIYHQKDIDVYVFGSDRFLETTIHVVHMLSESEQQSLAKETCLVFLSKLCDEAAITQVCFVATKFVEEMAELIKQHLIPEQYTQKLYQSMGKMPDVPPGAIDFACKICEAYANDPCDYLLESNLVPLSVHLINGAKTRSILPKKLFPVKESLIACLESRPTKEILSSFLDILTITLRAPENSIISQRLFNQVADACDKIYGDAPDISLFVRLLNIIGRSGTVFVDSIFPIALPEVAVLSIIIFRNSPLFDQVMNQFVKLARASEYNARMLHQGKLDQFILKALVGPVTWFGKEYTISLQPENGESVAYHLIEAIIAVHADHQIFENILFDVNPEFAPKYVTTNLLRIVSKIQISHKAASRPSFALGYRAYVKRETKVDPERLKRGFLFFFWLKKDLVRMKTMNREFILFTARDETGRAVRISTVSAGISVQSFSDAEVRSCMLFDDGEANTWYYFELQVKFETDSYRVSMRRNGEWKQDCYISIDDFTPPVTLTFGQLVDEEICTFDGTSPVKMGPFCVLELPENDGDVVAIDANSMHSGVDKSQKVVAWSDKTSIPERDPNIATIIEEEMTIEKVLPILLHVEQLGQDDLMNLLVILSAGKNDMNRLVGEKRHKKLNQKSQSLLAKLSPDLQYHRKKIQKPDESCHDISAMIYLLLLKEVPGLSFQLYLCLRSLVENRRSNTARVSLVKDVLLNVFVWASAPLDEFRKVLTDWRKNLIQDVLPNEALVGGFERLLIQGHLLVQSGSEAGECFKSSRFRLLEEIGKRSLSQRSVTILFSLLSKLENQSEIAEYLKMLNRILNDENKNVMSDDNIQCLTSLPLDKAIFLEMTKLLSLNNTPVAFRVLSELSNAFFSKNTLDEGVNNLNIACIECLYRKDKTIPKELLETSSSSQGSFWYFWPITLAVFRNDCSESIARFLANAALQRGPEFSRCVNGFYYIILLFEFFRAFECEDFRKELIRVLLGSFQAVDAEMASHLGQSIDKLFVLSTCRLSDTAHPNRSLERFTPFFVDNEFSFEVLKDMWQVSLDAVVLKQMFTDKEDIAEALGKEFTEFLKIGKIESSVKKMLKECMEMKGTSFERIMDNLAGRISVGIRALHSTIDKCWSNTQVIPLDNVFTNVKDIYLSELEYLLLQGQNVVDELSAKPPPPIHSTFKSGLLHGKVPVKREPRALPHFEEGRWLADLRFCDLSLRVSVRINRGALRCVFHSRKFLEIRISDISVVQYNKERCSVEIFTKTCESLYLKFSQEVFDEAQTIMISVGFPILDNPEESLKQLASQWVEQKLSTLDMIIAANVISGHSFHDETNSFIFPHFQLREMRVPPPSAMSLIGNTKVFLDEIQVLLSNDILLRNLLHQWLGDNFGIEMPPVNPQEEIKTELQISKFRADTPIVAGFFGSGEFFGILGTNGCFSVCTLSEPPSCRCVAQHKTEMSSCATGCCRKMRFLLFDSSRRLIGKKFETGYHEREATHVVNFAAFYDSNTIISVLDQAEIAMASLRSFPDKRRVLKSESDYIVAATVSKKYDMVVYVTFQSILKVLSINKGIEISTCQLPFEPVKRIHVVKGTGVILVEAIDNMYCLSISGEILSKSQLQYQFLADASTQNNNRMVGVTNKGAMDWFDPVVMEPHSLETHFRKCVGLSKVQDLVGLQSTGDVTVFKLP